MKIHLIIIFLILITLPVASQDDDELALTPPMGWNSWNKFGCNVNEEMIREMADAMAESGMRDALKSTGRPILFSICEWGDTKPWKWGEGVGHLWRTTADIRDCFQCEFDWGGLGVLNIIDKQADLYPYAGPGHWNDPDMLEVGNGGMGKTSGQWRSGNLFSKQVAPRMEVGL